MAEEVGVKHEVISLGELLPLLPKDDDFPDGFATLGELLETLMFQDRSGDRWCTSCGGYAVRRFDSAQCAYYRRVLQDYHSSVGV